MRVVALWVVGALCMLGSSSTLAHAPGEVAAKTASASPSPARLVAIDHATAARHAALRDVAALPTPTRTALWTAQQHASTPPVLLPADLTLLRSAQAVAGAHWVAVSMRGDRFSVYVHASAAVIDVPDLAGAHRAPAPPTLGDPHITRTHEIVTAHFVAFGVAYDVDIECLGGIDHPMCGDDALVRDLVRTMVRVPDLPRPAGAHR